MAKVKVAVLEDATLDYAVSVCEDLNIEIQAHPIEDCMCVMYFDRRSSGIFNPSNEWAQAGPIIEREGIGINLGVNQWSGTLPFYGSQCGNTPLQAAMRCYVAAKLGDTVEIPNELL